MARLHGALALVAAALVAGCGEDRGGSVDIAGDSTERATAPTTGTTATAPALAGPSVAKVRIREREYSLTPARPKVVKTGTVTFTVANDGKVDHALEVEGPDGGVETGPIEPGGRATLRVALRRAGDFAIYCPIGDHEKRGMRGRIEIAGGGEAGSDAHNAGGY